MRQCYYCRSALDSQVLHKNYLCPSCGSDLTCCRNCNFFNSERKCTEPNSPWIKDRELRNNCSYFEFRIQQVANPDLDTDTDLSEVERAKEAFRALFKTP